MKLYATVTSERASKGQGGNEYLYVKFMNNKQHVIARVDLKLDEDKNTFYLEIWEASGLTKHYIENPLYQAEKGNKQKGECKECGETRPCPDCGKCSYCAKACKNTVDSHNP